MNSNYVDSRTEKYNNGMKNLQHGLSNRFEKAEGTNSET